MCVSHQFFSLAECLLGLSYPPPPMHFARVFYKLPLKIFLKPVRSPPRPLDSGDVIQKHRLSRVVYRAYTATKKKHESDTASPVRATPPCGRKFRMSKTSARMIWGKTQTQHASAGAPRIGSPFLRLPNEKAVLSHRFFIIPRFLRLVLRP